MKDCIRVENISKKFSTTTALNSISFSLASNAILGILGENGAGKTTLLKILATLLTPDEGTAHINGFALGKEDTRIKQLIGIALSDERSFYWRLTGRQNIEFFASLYGIRKERIKEQSQRLFATLNIPEPDKRFDTYSTGTKRKLSLVRALLHTPKILLLDEPSKSLDTHTTEVLHGIIKEHNQQGCAVLLATHGLPEAEKLCHEFLVLSKGKLRGFGTPAELRTQCGKPQATLSELYKLLTHDR